MKKFDVEFTYMIDGTIAIEAENALAAAEKVELMLREKKAVLVAPANGARLTDSRSEVEFITEVKRKD